MKKSSQKFKFDSNKLGKKKDNKIKHKLNHIHAKYAIELYSKYNKDIIAKYKLNLDEKKLLLDSLNIIDTNYNININKLYILIKDVSSINISKNIKKILQSCLKTNKFKINKIYYEIKKKFNTFYIYSENFHEAIVEYMNKNKGNKKGYWTCHAFITKDDDNYENKIKKNLCPDSNLKVSKIDDMLNHYKSTEQILLEKDKNNEKLNKIEKIKLNLIKDNIMIEKKNDIDMLNKIGLSYKPKTYEGRYIYLMKVLQKTLETENIINLKKIHFKIIDEFKNINNNDYNVELNKLKNIINKEDMIECQLNELCDNVIPLNQKGFVKLDDFQIKTIENINKKISTIVSAPTSAGKTALSGYLFTKPGNYIIVVPTNALAWQMSAYISNIKKVSIPIITDTYQSKLNTYELVKKIIEIGCVVGTAKELVNILVLPEFTNFKVDWLLFDEIHMIGKDEGYDMEQILKLYNNTPFLGLSATIGNEKEFQNWLLTFNKNVDVIKYNKRFINLQKFSYNYIKNEIDRINPLSLIKLSEFKDKSILTKEISIHPKDIYDIYMKIKQYYNDIDHRKYFDSKQRLSLTDINNFFKYILTFMVKCINNNDNIMINILESYKINKYNTNNNENIEYLYNFIFKLKEEKKTPAIIFHKNSSVIENIIYRLSNYIKIQENKKYPQLFKDREKKEKKNKKNKDDNLNITEKQLIKNIINEEQIYEEIEIYEPHSDFIINTTQFLNKNIINDYENICNNYKYKFFPRKRGSYNWIFDLLYRGIGIYCKGFPDNYLRIVQKLATQKKLAIVFSDKELVFGVSMPFKTSVVLNDDSLNTMEYHQMAGRAGRRGLDKVGNVIFFGFNNNRIMELSISMIPNITGNNKSLNYMLDKAILLSNNTKFNNIKNNILCGDNTFYNNLSNSVNSNNKHLLHLLWLFRDKQISLDLENILCIVENKYKLLDPNIENNQILLAEYLLHFMIIKESKTHMNENELVVLYEKKYKKVNKNIDNILCYCIRDNRIINNDNILRNKILNFSHMIRFIQHYYYYRAEYYSYDSKYKKNEYINICRIFGKLFTRLLWMYYDSAIYIRY